MPVGDFIAAYAAVLSTFLAAWQVWKYRQSRRHHVELHLIHTRVGDDRSLFVEVHNRGDHAVRVVMAGVSSPTVTYSFDELRIEVVGASGLRMVIDRNEEPVSASNRMPTIPGIVLPRDGGMAMLPEEAVVVAVASMMEARKQGAPDLQELSDDDILGRVGLDLDGPLQAWVHLSTGEVIESKRETYDWEPR